MSTMVVLADSGFSGSSPLHRAVSGAMVSLGEKTGLGRSRPHSGGLACWGVPRFSLMRFFVGIPVIITGQGMGLFVYVRNLMLLSKARQRAS